MVKVALNFLPFVSVFKKNDFMLSLNPSADLFLIGNLRFVWLCNSCEIYIILLGLQLHFMRNLILIYNGNLCKIYVDFVLVVMAIYVKFMLILL